MTYEDFLRLALGATEFDDPSDYIAEEGGSVPEAVPDEVLVPMLTDIYDYGHDRSVATVRRIAGMSRAAFSRGYRLPVRSVENWETVGPNGRTAPSYLVDLIAFAVLSDKYL